MDYTTLATVKEAIRAKTAVTTDDSRISRAITDASRAIDRKCTGAPDSDAVDYFKLETKNNEMIPGRIDRNGVISCYPRKPVVASVTSFEFRLTPVDPWVSIDASRVATDGVKVEAYQYGTSYTFTACQVRITYSGGLAAVVADLPADLVNIATLLAVRFYREEETGLSDAIGVADAATGMEGVVYTKAFPERFNKMIQPFIRTVGWRYIA